MYKILILFCSIFFSYLDAGYCFKNDSEESSFVTIYDQNNDLVIDRFKLLPYQELILSCKYLTKQQIKALKIFQSKNNTTSTSTDQKGIWISINCPNCNYLLYNLQGTLISHQESKTAVAAFKNNLRECIFIKRGFIQKSLFLRNIEEDKELRITLKDENENPLLENYSVESNEELYLPDLYLQHFKGKKIKLRVVSTYRSDKSKKPISLYDTTIPTDIITFDAQHIYLLALGLQGLLFRSGMNQFNETTQQSLEHLPAYQHYLRRTLFNDPRTNHPRSIKKVQSKKKSKYVDVIFKNSSTDIYDVQIRDQNKEIVVTSIVLHPKEKIHFASSYLQDQSIHGLELIARYQTEEKELSGEENKCTLVMMPKDKHNYCEKYTIFGEYLTSYSRKNFQERVRSNLSSCTSLKRGFCCNGYSLRNIQTEDLEITVKDNHSRPILDHHKMTANSEIYFNQRYLSQEKIEYILVTVHMPSETENSKNLKDSVTFIKTPHYNFDNQKVYNLALGLKGFLIGFPLTQFNERSSKPLPVHGKFATYLYKNTLFYEPRTESPLLMKTSAALPIGSNKEIEGPISPSTKI